MTEDFLLWARIDEPRWQALQGKLKRLIETERSPARIMMALMDDIHIDMREQVVLSYWLGRQQAMLETPVPALTHRRMLRSCLN